MQLSHAEPIQASTEPTQLDQMSNLMDQFVQRMTGQMDKQINDMRQEFQKNLAEQNQRINHLVNFDKVMHLNVASSADHPGGEDTH